MLALLLSVTVALACPGNPNCTDSHCNMPAASVGEVQATGAQATIDVEGMKCGNCANTVQAALLKVPGVTGAQVDSATGKAVVSYDPAKTSVDALVKAIQDGSHFTAKPAKV